jgi:hypothetical protein
MHKNRIIKRRKLVHSDVSQKKYASYIKTNHLTNTRYQLTYICLADNSQIVIKYMIRRTENYQQPLYLGTNRQKETRVKAKNYRNTIA